MRLGHVFTILLTFEGLLLASGRLRIVGGNTTTIEKHPWMVSIQFLRVHFCGGSIVSEDTIITAAHCLTRLITNAYQIVAGVTDLAEPSPVIRVNNYIIHDQFDSDNLDYDIAVMKLREKFTFNEKIQPISLPDEDLNIEDGSTVSVSGWGVTSEEDEETSNILREVDLQIAKWEICQEKLSYYREVTERMICAGSDEGGKDTCLADSGGALELDGTLIGIVSWGKGCGEADYPGVYTDVRHLRSWIRQHAGV